MDFNAYIESKRLASAKKKIPQEIRERWNTRIVTRSLQTLGRSGGVQYLRDYGKGLAAPKAINLALMAESEGYPEMAKVFWAKAFELETGQKAVEQKLSESKLSTLVRGSSSNGTVSNALGVQFSGQSSRSGSR